MNAERREPKALRRLLLESFRRESQATEKS